MLVSVPVPGQDDMWHLVHQVLNTLDTEMFSPANMRKGACKHRNLPNGGGRSVLTVRRPSPGNVSGRVKRDDRGRHVSHLRRRRMGFGFGKL